MILVDTGVWNLVDCLIAACAIQNDSDRLQDDRDYRHIATVSRLRLRL
ncbi:MAG: hypothetical protein IZT59_07020 [Verrucomicrobia bacterium]|nr:hypothetical protein [Verrucomicrobiota bacterium]